MMNLEGGASRTKFVHPTETTAPVGAIPPLVGTAGVYTFNEGLGCVFVQNHPDSLFNIYGVWNDVAGSLEAALGAWDFVLGPGESISSKDVDDSLIVKTVGLYLDNVPPTGFKTDYTIRGR